MRSCSSSSGCASTAITVCTRSTTGTIDWAASPCLPASLGGWTSRRVVGANRPRTKSPQSIRRRSSGRVRVLQSVTGATRPAAAKRGPLARRPAGVAPESPIASYRPPPPRRRTPSPGSRSGPCRNRCRLPFPNRTRRPTDRSPTTRSGPAIASCCPCRRSSSRSSSSYRRKRTGRSCRTYSATCRRCSRTSTFSVGPSPARRWRGCWSRCAAKSPRASWRRVS